MSKLALSIALAGFIVIGSLLMTNHWGFAIKITSYLFLLLLIGIYV